MNDGPLRWGILGTGNIARQSFERTIAGFGTVGDAGANTPGWANDPEHTIRISPRT